MLDPKSLDLDELCAALEDHSPDATWWIHTDDGRIRSGGPGGAGWIAIGSVGSHEGYRDMAEFVAGVHHRWTARSRGAAHFAGSRTPSSSSPSCASSGSATATPARGGGPCGGWPTPG